MTQPTFRELALELHALLAEERKAIGKLDHERLTYLAEQKRAVAEQLERARDTSKECRDVLVALRNDAQANAMLASAAAEAVRALLGREVTGYDRRARRVTSAADRPLATY